jgi:hypothetical protein
VLNKQSAPMKVPLTTHFTFSIKQHCHMRGSCVARRGLRAAAPLQSSLGLKPEIGTILLPPGIADAMVNERALESILRWNTSDAISKFLDVDQLQVNLCHPIDRSS